MFSIRLAPFIVMLWNVVSWRMCVVGNPSIKDNQPTNQALLIVLPMLMAGLSTLHPNLLWTMITTEWLTIGNVPTA